MRGKILIWIVALILLCSVAHASLTDGLTHVFALEENGATPYVDEMGSLNFTTADVPTRTTGVVNFGQNFTQTADNYLETVATSNFSCPSRTISFMINLPDFASADNYMRPVKYYYNDAGNYRGYYYQISNTGTISTYQYTGAGVVNFDSISTTTLNAGTWEMLTFVDTPGNAVDIFINGTEVAYASHNAGTVSFSGTTEYETAESNVAGGLDGAIDEYYFWCRNLSDAEIGQLYSNLSSGVGYPFSGGVPPANATTDVLFTAVDDWNSTSINSFAINITWQNGTQETYSTATGTINVSDVGNPGSLNVTFWNVTDYFDTTLNDQSITENVTNNIQASMFQAIICFNASAKVSGAAVTPDNFTIDSTTQTSCFNLSADSYNVQAQLNGWFSQNQTFTVSALDNTTLTVQNMSYANLTIYAYDGTTNESLTGYSLSINSLNHTGWPGESTGAVTNHTFSLINGTYNVSIDMPGYALDLSEANISVSGHTEYNFTLYKTNSVQIYIWDEITGDPITENITIRWTSNTTTWENTTDDGQYFIINITADVYELLFYGSNYSTRTYTITVGNRSTQTLNAYMIASTYSTIFTIKDIDTASILDGVAITMYKQINSSWTTVESKFSDISGKAQFYYDPIAHYRFYLSNADYEDYIFYLNPILFSEYDVFMTKTSVLNYSVDFDGISIIYSPTMFYNDQNASFNFLISSPDGLLTNYGIKLTYPGGSDFATGNNAIGEQLSADVNLSNSTTFDVVVLEFNYTTSLSGERTYIVNLPIITNSTPGATWISNKEHTYGMGLFERMLIATIIILFVVGIATMVGQVLPGLALGLFMYGFLVFIGFVPLWAILPSMLVGVLFLIWKSGGY